MISPDTKTILVNAHSDDPLKQVQALIELIGLHDESVTPEILDLLSSADEDVRAESARALGYLGDRYREKIGPALLKLVNDENQRVRNEAVEALGLQPLQQEKHLHKYSRMIKIGLYELQKAKGLFLAC